MLSWTVGGPLEHEMAMGRPSRCTDFSRAPTVELARATRKLLYRPNSNYSLQAIVLSSVPCNYNFRTDVVGMNTFATDALF